MTAPGSSPQDPLKLEAFKTALATRNLEISLFWQRSNYFLVLNTAIAVGFFSRDAHDMYAFALSIVGLVVTVLWVRINLGSKFWQSRWEHRLRVVEDQLWPGLDLFSAEWDVIRADVEESLKNSGGWRVYNWAVLRKPSVSKTMTILSVFFVLVWIGAAVVSARHAFW